MNELNKFLIKKKESFGKEKGADLSFESEHSMDLFASLHGCDLWLSGEKNEDGTWDLEVEITDKYDFTDLKNPFVQIITETIDGEEISYEQKASLSYMAGWLANDAAYFSQQLGEITPFDVKIRFTMKNYKVE